MAEHSQDGPGTPGPRIVVGVDGSQGSKTALAWAVAHARLAGAAVEAVTAWQDPVQAGYGFAYAWSPGPADYGAVRDAAAKTLNAAMSETSRAGRDEPVPIHASVVEGHPGDVLLEAAATACLLVVGTRGHNPFAGLMLGSVSQYCVQHALCPVVVVPPVVGRRP